MDPETAKQVPEELRNGLKVKKDPVQFIALVVAAAIMLPLGIGILWGQLSKGANGSLAFAAIGLFNVALFCVVAGLYWRATRKGIKAFTKEGVVRNDGMELMWKHLKRVEYQMHRTRFNQAPGIWRIEIIFENDHRAWILPLRVRNYPEVFGLVNQLPCEHKEVNV